MNIPFLDLKTQYLSLKDELDDVISDIIKNTSFIGGDKLRIFENEFAKYIGTKYCIGVGNGTEALVIAMKSLGIGPGDEVITVANSFIATSEAITSTGAKVVFVDCHPDFYTIDVDKIEEKITKKTKAIIPVHLYGQAAQMDKVMELARKYDLYVIEDSAQAHGAKFKDQKIGTFGDLATFSFYPGKNLGAYGDGGAILTNNEKLAKFCKMYANHGRMEKYNHKFEGVNSRLDTLQASILNVKLKYLEQWNIKRREVAKIYDENLKKIKDIVIPKNYRDSLSVYHLYVIRTEKRDELKDFLKKENISTGIHYPIGLPFLEAYNYLQSKPEDFPITYDYQDKLLSLPIYPELTEKMQYYVIEKIQEFFD